MNYKLYAIYLGGKAAGANTEVHDTVFLLSVDINKDKEKIKKLWFGDQKSVHIDAFAEVDGVGEYKIIIENLILEGLKHEPLITTEKNLSESEALKLFFINFGASDLGKLSEKHESGFFVAKDKSGAIQQAKQVFLVDQKDVHLDNSLKIDDCIDKSDKFIRKIVILKAENTGVLIHNKYIKL